MSALLALAVTGLVTLVAALLDWTFSGAVTRVVFAPVPGLAPWLLGARAAVPIVTAIYLFGVYLAASVLARFAISFARASAGMDGGGITGWLADADIGIREDDAGRWPVALIIVCAAVAALGAPLVLLGRVHVVPWVAAVLTGITLLRIYRSRVRASTAAGDASKGATGSAPAGGLRRTGGVAPSAMVRRLWSMPGYRGQIRATTTAPARTAGLATIEEPRSAPGRLEQAVAIAGSLAIPGFTGLYQHQLVALDALLARPTPGDPATDHVVITTGGGSGRWTLQFIALLERTLGQGRHALVILPSAAEARAAHARYRREADRTAWSYAVEASLLTLPWDGQVGNPPPEILFTSIDALHEALLPNAGRWGEFLVSLDLVVLPDLHRYGGLFGTDAAMVLRRLRSVVETSGTRIQVLATSIPAENVEGALRELGSFGPDDDRVLVVNVDSGPFPERVIAAWIPALERAPSPETTEARLLRRQSESDAVIDLGEMLLADPAVRVVVHPMQPGRINATGVMHDLAARLGVDLPPDRFSVVESAADLARIVPDRDVVILAGAAWSVAALERAAGRVGARRSGGLVIALSANDPAMRRLVTAIADVGVGHGELPGLILPIDPSYEPSLRKHFALAFAEAPMDRARIGVLFGRSGMELARRWVSEGRLQAISGKGEDDEQHQLLVDSRPTALRAGELPLGAIGTARELIRIEDLDGRTAIAVDAERSPLIITPGRRIARADTWLHITEAPDGSLRAEPPGVHDSATWVPLYRVRAGSDARTIGLRAITLFDGDRFVAAPLPVSIDHELVALRDSRDATTTRDATIVELADPQAVTVRATAVVMTVEAGEPSLAVAHTLSHLIALVLRGRFGGTTQQGDWHVAVVPELEGATTDPCVLVYESLPGSRAVATQVQASLASILSETYRLLIACPCQDGCWACIRDPYCTTIVAGSDRCAGTLDKRATIAYLSRILRRQAVAIVGRGWPELEGLRYGDTASIDDLIRIRDTAATMGLGPLVGGSETAAYKPADIRYMTTDEMANKGLLGFFQVGRRQSSVIAIRRDSEALMVQTIAHELAHDWQHENRARKTDSLPKDPISTLIAEGFAQWMELRLVDGYGFREHFDEIVFRIYDEYGEGFRVFKAIEDRAGVAGVLRAAREGLSAERFLDILRSTGALSRAIDLEARMQAGGAPLPPIDIVPEPTKPVAPVAPPQPPPPAPAPPPPAPAPATPPSPPKPPEPDLYDRLVAAIRRRRRAVLAAWQAHLIAEQKAREAAQAVSTPATPAPETKAGTSPTTATPAPEASGSSGEAKKPDAGEPAAPTDGANADAPRTGDAAAVPADGDTAAGSEPTGDAEATTPASKPKASGGKSKRRRGAIDADAAIRRQTLEERHRAAVTLRDTLPPDSPAYLMTSIEIAQMETELAELDK